MVIGSDRIYLREEVLISALVVDGLKYLYLPKGLMQSMCLLYVLISIVELLGFMLVMLVGEDTFDRDDVRQSQRFNKFIISVRVPPNWKSFN